MVDKLLEIITSMKFAIAMLVFLAIFMVAGSFLSDDLFTSSYLFAFLVGLLFLSLLLCLIRRILRISKVIKDANGGTYNVWVNALGSPVMHIGILLIIAGMFMGQFTGFSGIEKITVGQTYVEDNAGFEVKLDSFEVVYDEEYNITDYISAVTVVEGGTEVFTKEITVNSPLAYKGVKFYQSTYGWAAKAKIMETETGEVLLDRVINLGIGNSGVGMVDYSMFDSESKINITQRFMVIPDQASNGTVNNLSPLPNNPALFFILYHGPDISIIQDVGLGESEDIGGLTISFENLDYYSGLSISSKPELPLVFAGSILFTVGLIMVFYIRINVVKSQMGGN